MTARSPAGLTMNNDLRALLVECRDFIDDCRWTSRGNDLIKRLDAALSAPALSGRVSVPRELHPETAELVIRFCTALAEKLCAAQKKYGYTNGWMQPDWVDDCRKRLREHVEKGDPRDVAAYCAFLWYHGESTKIDMLSAAPAVGEEERG